VKKPSSTKTPTRDELRNKPHAFWHERYETEQALEQLTGTRRGPTLGFRSVVYETPADEHTKAVAITTLRKKLAAFDRTYRSVRSQALKGLREKKPALLSEPFTYYGAALLEDPDIRAALAVLYHAKLDDPHAKRCLDAFGKAFAAKVSGTHRKVTPVVASEIVETNQAWKECGQRIKQLWKSEKCGTSRQRRQCLIRRGLTQQQAESIEEDFLNRSPSAWACVRTARDVGCSEETVRRECKAANRQQQE
jgi:hypothetical protein